MVVCTYKFKILMTAPEYIEYSTRTKNNTLHLKNSTHRITDRLLSKRREKTFVFSVI